MTDQKNRRTGTSARPRRGARNLWPRRIITGSGLLLIVVLVVWGIWSIVSALLGGEHEDASQPTAGSSARTGAHSDSQSGAQSGRRSDDQQRYQLEEDETLTSDGIYNETTGQVRQPQCLASDITISAAGQAGTVGSEQGIAVTMLNTSKTSCLMSLGLIDVAIYTGEELVYDSAKCSVDDGQSGGTPRSKQGKTLLLSPGKKWSGSITWDGKVYEAGCREPESGLTDAQAGTYYARLTVDSAAYGDQIYFQIADPIPADSE